MIYAIDEVGICQSENDYTRLGDILREEVIKNIYKEFTHNKIYQGIGADSEAVMIFISTRSLSSLFLFTLIHIFIHISLLSSSAVAQKAGDGSDENAVFAQIMINDREYRIDTPELSGSDVEAQLLEFHPSDTCVPFSGGTYEFVEPIERVDSARLIGGPPGFGFVLWSDIFYEYVSGAVNWDKPNLDRRPIPWIEAIDPDEYARMPPQFLMRQVNRIVW